MEIQSTARERASVLPGVTGVRLALRRQMEEKAYIVAKAMVSWANKHGKGELAANMDVSLKTLARERSAFFAERIQLVIATAQSILPELEAYGMDAGSVAELEALLEAYRKRMPSTRMAISHRRKGTQRLVILFREADRLLVEELDPLMETYRGSDPYLVFRSTRKPVGNRRAQQTPAEPAPEPEVEVPVA